MHRLLRVAVETVSHDPSGSKADAPDAGDLDRTHQITQEIESQNNLHSVLAADEFQQDQQY